MKKIILFIVLTLSVFLVSCKNNDNPDNPDVPLQTDAEILNEFSEEISFDEPFAQNLELLSEYSYKGKTIKATWTSEDETILANDGTITRINRVQYVNLSLKLTLNNETLDLYYEVTIAALSDEELADKILDTVVIEKEISESIKLPRKTTYLDKSYTVFWDTKTPEYISDRGEIIYQSEDVTGILTARVRINDVSYTRDIEITIKKFDTTDMENFLNTVTIPNIASGKLDLPMKKIINQNIYLITWTSSHPDIIDNQGQVSAAIDDTVVTLTANMQIQNAVFSKEFKTTVKKSPIEDIKAQLFESVHIPGKISRDILLPTELVYGLNGTWKSSNTNVISNDGIINQELKTPTSVDITLTVTIKEETMTHTYNTTVCPEKHIYIDSTFAGEKLNTVINKKGKLVLADGELSGTYYSGKIDSNKFGELVGSWAAVTSQHATCELQISLRVNGAWSEYITYGKWGLGLHNKGIDQNKDLIELSTDEVKVKNKQLADGFQFKLTLERDDISVQSPEVSLVSLAFKLDNYSFDIDKSLLNKKVRYDVPRLYQHDVPGIGNRICSATSSTMLLKYKGHDFSKINPLEHEYVAGMVNDYGHDIYGNWVFNTVGMSGFGEISYVKRFFGVNEFLYSIQKIGPMAASIRGKMIYHSEVNNIDGSYNTGGHLIVVTGFEITDTQTYVYINDPNVRGVAIKVKLADFLNVWVRVAYIVE